MKTSSKPLATAALLIAVGSSLSGANILSENADYGANDISMQETVVGTAGGGWSAGWNATPGANYGKYESSASLSYTATGYTNTVSAGRMERANNTALHERPFSTVISDSTIWVSALVLASRGDGRSNSKLRMLGDLAEVRFGFEDIAPGEDIPGNENQGIMFVGGTSVDTGATVFDTSTHLFLVKISLNQSANDVISFWIDPDVSTVSTFGEAGLSAATLTLSGVDLGDSITAAGFSLSLPTSAMDALRISSGFSNSADALNAVLTTTVPEPSTYALMLGFVTLGSVLIRRRLRD